MGAYTFTQFQTYLKLRFGDNDAWDSYFPVWINSAYRQLCTTNTVWELRRNLYIPELETSATADTVDGTAYISSPADTLIVREIYDTDNNLRLNWMPWSEYIGRTDRTTAANEGKPTKWHRQGGYIFLYPTPDDAYTMTIYYKKRVADLTGTDVTAIGAEWDDIILEIAHYYGRMWNNEYDKAKISKEAAKEKIAELMTGYWSEERARRESIRPNENMTGPTY